MKSMILLLLLLCLTGCGSSEPNPAEKPQPTETTWAETLPMETIPPETEPPDPVTLLLEEMTLEEKVGQLFLARCPGENGLEDIGTYHLGGYVLFDRDIQGETVETLVWKIADYQDAAKIPMFIAADEEGGTVCRVSNHDAFRAYPFPAPRELYAQGGMEMVLSIEAEKAILLNRLGINVNLAPVCDMTDDPAAFMYHRSFGADTGEVSRFVTETGVIMAEFGVGSVMKHFPGYGDNADTHTGIAVDDRTLEELEGSDLLPFAAGIASGMDAIMVSHTIVNALDDSTPASLSAEVHRYLREDMGFQGVITTDDLVMEAITDLYGPGESAVLAVQAGNDLLCCTEYRLQYEAVLAAVQAGRIQEERINESVERILRWKQELGLIH